MAELADALDSGSSEGNFMQVRFLLPAPNSINPNLLIVGDGFGFIVFEKYPNFNNKTKNVKKGTICLCNNEIDDIIN